MRKKAWIGRFLGVAILATAGISTAPTTSWAQSMTFTCVASNGARTFRGVATAPNPAARPAARTRAILAARRLCGANTKQGNYCVMSGCRPY